MLDPTKIGYLRTLPGPGVFPLQGVGANKRMWNKLRHAGYVDSPMHEYFRRSEAGQKALLEYDGALSDAALSLLDRVRRGDRTASSERGFSTLVSAGLVRVSGSLRTSVVEPSRPDDAEAEAPGPSPRG